MSINSQKQKAFELFSQGFRPSEIYNQVTVKPKTLYTYFQDWKQDQASLEYQQQQQEREQQRLLQEQAQREAQRQQAQRAAQRAQRVAREQRYKADARLYNLKGHERHLKQQIDLWHADRGKFIDLFIDQIDKRAIKFTMPQDYLRSLELQLKAVQEAIQRAIQKQFRSK